MAPRKAKPQKVGQVQDQRHRLFFDVCFDKNEKTFTVVVDAANIVSAKSYDECVVAARKLFETWEPFTWAPFIEVKYTTDEDTSHHDWRGEYHPVQIELDFWRMEYAQRDGRWYSRKHVADWDGNEDFPRKISQDHYHDNADILRVPYTDERWAELQTIEKALRGAQAKLKVLFAPGDDFRLISAAAANVQKLLGSGT